MTANRGTAPHRNRTGGADVDGSDILDRGPNPDDATSVDFDETARQPVGVRPASDVSAGDQSGTGEEETADGLSESEEAMRRAAEDVPDREGRAGDLPVFDEAEAPPTIWDDEAEDEDDEAADDEEDGADSRP